MMCHIKHLEPKTQPKAWKRGQLYDWLNKHDQVIGSEVAVAPPKARQANMFLGPTHGGRLANVLASMADEFREM